MWRCAWRLLLASCVALVVGAASFQLYGLLGTIPADWTTGRRVFVIMGTMLLVFLAVGILTAIAYPLSGLRTKMSEQEVEAVLGKPYMRTQDTDQRGIGVYPAARNGLYVVTFDGDGRVAQYDFMASVVEPLHLRRR